MDKRIVTAAVVIVALASTLRAQERRQRRQPDQQPAAQSQPATAPSDGEKKPEGKPDGKPEAKPDGDKLSVTEHEISIHGRPLKYKTTAGTIQMKDEAGKHKADVFFVAYEKQPASDRPGSRPITYVFNGGPGA